MSSGWRPSADRQDGPAGPAAALPLHAAGRHPGAARRKAMTGQDPIADSSAGRVISSYTPTLAALIRALARPAPGPVRQLAVGLNIIPLNRYSYYQ